MKPVALNDEVARIKTIVNRACNIELAAARVARLFDSKGQLVMNSENDQYELLHLAAAELKRALASN